MKTAKQWAIRVQNSKEPWEKLVMEIQVDALNEAIMHCQNEHLETISDMSRLDDIAYDSAINDCVVAIISIRDPLIPNQGPISIAGSAN